jgi:predicted metalloenzyme YecM
MDNKITLNLNENCISTMCFKVNDEKTDKNIIIGEIDNDEN